MIYYLLVLIGVFSCSASQLLLKKSALKKQTNVLYMLLDWRVIVSYSIMFVTLLANIFAMKNGVELKDMSILEASGYIFVPLLSWLVLSERISKYTIIAILFILLGIIVFYA